MENNDDIIIVEIEKKIKARKEKEKDNEKQICYICQEKPTDPINPSGCVHFFCRAHLKVI